MFRVRRGRDRMVAGFITAYVQSVPIITKVVNSNPSDEQQVDGFVRVLRKTDQHDITEILLKVALNTITLTLHKHINTKVYAMYIYS